MEFKTSFLATAVDVDVDVDVEADAEEESSDAADGLVDVVLFAGFEDALVGDEIFFGGLEAKTDASSSGLEVE